MAVCRGVNRDERGHTSRRTCKMTHHRDIQAFRPNFFDKVLNIVHRSVTEGGRCLRRKSAAGWERGQSGSKGLSGQCAEEEEEGWTIAASFVACQHSYIALVLYWPYCAFPWSNRDARQQAGGG